MQGSNVAATFQCMNVRCASYLSAGTAFSQVPALGLFAVMAQLSIQKLHHSTRCTADSPASQPASQPTNQSASQSASLITLGFHTLPDHNAYLPSTSPQLRCLQLEMTITCSVIVGCLFFPPQLPG